jgi:hypothetical protein
MTASSLVTVFCDAPSCGRWDDAGVGDTAEEARRGLTRLGWVVAVPDPDGYRRRFDYCPLHADLARK